MATMTKTAIESTAKSAVLESLHLGEDFVQVGSAEYATYVQVGEIRVPVTVKLTAKSFKETVRKSGTVVEVFDIDEQAEEFRSERERVAKAKAERSAKAKAKAESDTKARAKAKAEKEAKAKAKEAEPEVLPEEDEEIEG